MTYRDIRRVLALAVTIGMGLGAYFLQPDNLAVFASQRSAAVFIGAAMVVLGILNNWLPSMFEGDVAPRG